MRKHQIENISWQEVLWQRPYDLEAVQNILAQLANLTPRGAVIWEIRGRNGQVSHLLGADKQYIGKIEEVFRAHGDVKFHTLPRAARLPVGMAKQLRITHPQLSLKTDIAEAVIRAGLAAMTEDRDGTELVLQVILGMAYPPAPIPASLPDPHATWLEVLIGDVHQATAESRKAVREKAEQYSFQAMIRIGASGVNGLSRLRSILSALKVLESAGVRMLLQKTFSVDHLTKKRMVNHGERRRYYIENSHEPIIDKETFAKVQQELARRAEKFQPNAPFSGEYPFTGLIRCGFCGGYFRRKITASGTKYAKPVWICPTFNTYGKDICSAQQIPEKILIEKTSEVLGTADWDRETLLSYVSEIWVPEHNLLMYVFRDGHTEEVAWQNPSRRESWSDEMKQTARERQLRMIERRRKDDGTD